MNLFCLIAITVSIATFLSLPQYYHTFLLLPRDYLRNLPIYHGKYHDITAFPITVSCSKVNIYLYCSCLWSVMHSTTSVDVPDLIVSFFLILFTAIYKCILLYK